MTTDSKNVSALENSIPSELPQRLSEGRLKTLDQVVQFHPETYVKRPIFNTDMLQFGMYCLESGQTNPLHRHPGSDEIIYFVQGTGEVTVGDEIAAVQPGVSVHIPPDVTHEIRNTGLEPMLVILVQSPLPCKTERITRRS